MYEEPKITFLLFLKEDVLTASSGFDEEFSDDNVDDDGWV